MGITPELGSILSGQADAKSTEFRDSYELSRHLLCNPFLQSLSLLGIAIIALTNTLTVIEMQFENGEEKLKDLELRTFVGAGRFLVEAGKPVTLEYKLSKVIKG